MSRLGTAISLGLLLVGTAAQAQSISNLSTSAGTNVVYPAVPRIETYGQTGPTPPGTSTFGTFGGTDFSSFVTNADGLISFESSNVASGLQVQSYSNTMVSFTFVNDGPAPVTFESLITPAGVGFYLADVNPSCAYSSCDQVTGVGLLTDVFRANPFAPAGAVGFEFVIQDNGQDLYRVTGQSSLSYGLNGAAFFDDQFGTGTYLNGTGARGMLRNFTLATDPFDASAHGFAWDATEISFLLGQGTHNLTYKTSVFSTTNAFQLACGASLVAYAGFGDPIGRGGGVESIESLGGDFQSFALGDGCEVKDGGIGGVEFTETTFEEPVIIDGELVFDRVAAVPEPATWAMMILGFGGIGAALRRRRLQGAPA